MEQSKNILKLIAYKTEKGLFYATTDFDYNKQRKGIYNKSVNGKIPVKSEWKSDWYFLEGEYEITSVTEEVSGGYGEAYWELRDHSTHIQDIIPVQISCEGADEINDDGVWYIGSESKYHPYRGLYTRKREKNPNIIVDVPYEVEYKGEIKQTLVENDYSSMKISLLSKSGWSEKQKEVDLSEIVHYYELEELLTPDLVIHNRPCYINADTTYSIVRNHIKSNIDTKHARITSDYDFCFTVKKKIQIKPYIHKTEQTKANGRSYAKPRFTTKTIEHKEAEIFEMCPSEPYQKYTPIKGFTGDNLKDLVENIKLYLDELMDVINKPVKECEGCGGTGCTFDKVENMNDR
jgi:hypothetical protein